MALTLFAHPFSSYCQKALIAFYELEVEFTFRQLGLDEETGAEFATLWPIKRFPVLVDDGKTILESSIIIEHIDRFYGKPPRLIPDEPYLALEVRKMDRIFDNYIQTPQQKIVFDAIRPAEVRDPYGVTEARTMLDTIYRWLDQQMADKEWAAGDRFTLADCAAAPALFYADWTHAIPQELTHLHAYRRRLLARPSFARAVDEARPYRKYFPLGAPDRD